MRRLLLAIALVGCVCLSALADTSPQVFRVGVTSFRDKAATVQEWQATADFLSARIANSRFEVVPLNLPEFDAALAAKSLDFLITNPQHYIAMESRHAVSRVATVVKSEGGKIVNQFGGVIFTRADRSDISSIEALRGKRIAATDPTSFAAYLIQSDLMLEAGINPQRDARIQFMGFPQDLTVQAVLDGRSDVGFVRSGLLEYMAQEGKLRLDQVQVVHRMHAADFPFMVSSALYPEWPLATAPHVPIDITNQVVAALLLMPPNSQAAKKGRYYRWSTPVEYQSVQAFMQRRQIYPFDKPEALSVRRVVLQYAPQLMALASVVALLLAVLYWRSYRLNQALVASRRALSDMAHYDALTGLPNRNLLDDRLQQALTRAQREENSVALCMLDLDGFKPINDQFGHSMGDLVLKEVALGIKQAVRNCDTVGRFGGDEFVVLLNGFGDQQTLEDILVRVLSAVEMPLACCPQAKVSASVGVSVLGQDAQDSNTLFRHADEAMYQAKVAGGNRFVRYGMAQSSGTPVLD